MNVNNFGSRESKVTNFCNKQKRVYNFLKDNWDRSYCKRDIALECRITFNNELLNILSQLKYFKLIEENKEQGTLRYRYNLDLRYI